MREKVPVSIRLAVPDDALFIREMAERVWWAHYPEIISDDQIRYMLDAWYNEDLIRSQIGEKSHDFWLITPEGQETPCGYLVLSRKPEQGSYYLNKFYLEGRGKGIGEAAFYKVLAQYPDMEVLRLNVNRRNFRSVNFYFKIGFKIESVMDLQVNEDYIMDDFVMVRKG